MPEPTYTITITESERTALARALGLFVAKLTSAPVFVEASAGGTQAARAVLSPPATASPTAQPSGHLPPTPIETRDRWTRDRKGNEVPNPLGCHVASVVLWRTEQKKGKTGEYLKVSFSEPHQGHSDASCFDAQLFPWLIKEAQERRGQPSTVYLTENGKYLNIVGVRA